MLVLALHESQRQAMRPTANVGTVISGRKETPSPADPYCSACRIRPKRMTRCSHRMSARQTFGLVSGLNDGVTKRIGIALLAVVLAVSGCGSPSPVAPTGTQQVAEAAAALATIRGQIFADVDWGDPAIADALVEVRKADGATTTVRSDEDGFYQVSVRSGIVSVTASKEGYEPKTWQLLLLDHAVLNFGLTPR